MSSSESSNKAATCDPALTFGEGLTEVRANGRKHD